MLFEVGEKELGLDAAKRVDSQDVNLVFKADIGAAVRKGRLRA